MYLAVSYTHLDVYKRQDKMANIWRRTGNKNLSLLFQNERNIAILIKNFVKLYYLMSN